MGFRLQKPICDAFNGILTLQLEGGLLKSYKIWTRYRQASHLHTGGGKPLAASAQPIQGTEHTITRVRSLNGLER